MGFHAAVPGFSGGSIGVLVFFVLSGYLITTILVHRPAETAGALGRFYWRRTVRLLPALAVLVGTTLIWAATALPAADRAEVFRQAVPSLLYVQNFVLVAEGEHADFSLLAHTWSLAVEQQFYLLWPLVLVALHSATRRGGRLRWSMTATVGALLGCATALLLALSAAGLSGHVGVGLDGNAAPLLTGCWLAVLRHEHPAFLDRWVRRPRWPAPVALTTLGLLVATGTVLPWDLQRCLGALCSAVVIGQLAAATRTPGRTPLWQHLVQSRPLVHLGLISYSLYLWHLLVYDAAKRLLSVRTLDEKLLWAPLTVATCLAIAWLSYRFVELPALALLDRRRRRNSEYTPSTEAAITARS
ncbi:hypothetical protein NUM3379_18060 [Kineococcus sp. NUM-3379]